MMNKDYIPIPCATYNQYETAILRGYSLRVGWKGARAIDRVETLNPQDLRTRAGAEYMIAQNQLGQYRVIRLDRIKYAQTLRPM
jgi:Rho-binding antiterminator